MFTKENIESLWHTFASTFLTVLIAQLSLIPADKILDSATWTTAAISGLILMSSRAAFKAIWPILTDYVKTFFFKLKG